MPSTNVATTPASRVSPFVVAETDPGAPFVAIDDVNGDNWVNINNRMLVIIKNITANDLTVDFVTSSSHAGIALPDEQVVIGANQLCIIGPFPNAEFGSGGSNTTIEISYAGTTPDGKILILDIKPNDA